MSHIHVNKELTDSLEAQGYHLVDKHQLAKMQQLEKVAEAAWIYTNTPMYNPHAPYQFVRLCNAVNEWKAMK